jgi:pimeloyl-ACP methyl ester carboxylesterase
VKPPARERFATSGGELSYVDGGAGKPVVLLHGFPASSYLWRREIPLLATRMRVIAPDLLGYGESDKPPGTDLSIRAQAAYVGELLAGLGVEEAAVVGHDIGGGVAQLLATTGMVRTLILLDTVVSGAWPSGGLRAIQSMASERETKEVAERLARRAFEVGTERKGLLTPADVDVYVAPWLAVPAALFRAARGVDGQGLEGVQANLAAHGMPIFVMWGEEDPFYPAGLAERMLEELPGATVALLPGCGHLVTEDAPTTVGPLIFEFLRRWYLGEGHAGHGSDAGPVPVFLERPPAGFDDDPYANED